MRITHGVADSTYVSMDDEMIGRSQIYSREVDCDEEDGPFSKVFLIDAANVFALMEKSFGKTNWWTNARQYSKKKEGRKAWRAFIKYHFLGNDRAVTIADMLRNKLQSAAFAGPKRNWDFVKFCNLHTNAHIPMRATWFHTRRIRAQYSPKTRRFNSSRMVSQTPISIQLRASSTANSQRYKYDTFEELHEDQPKT